MFEVHPPKYCHHVLVLHMRKTTIANLIAKSDLRLGLTSEKVNYRKIHNKIKKPYITYDTQDIYITVSKCIHSTIVPMSWTYKLEGEPSQFSQQNLHHPVCLRQFVGSKQISKSKSVNNNKGKRL